MNKKRIGIFITLLVMACVELRAQSATGLKIDEVLIISDQNYQDDYGLHNAWIEIFNTPLTSINLEGCFLTNDKNSPTKYPILKGNMLALIKPCQHALFWADRMPNRGTFHVDFTLDPDRENYIAPYDSSGKVLINEVTIPASQFADRPYAREKDGSASWIVKGGGEHSYITPDTNNITIDKNPRIEDFKKHGSINIDMTIIAMSVVFIGLVLLYLSFRAVGNIAVRLGKKSAMKTTGITDGTETKEKDLGSHTGEEIVAITMTLHEYLNDARGVEDMVLTISKVKRTYSPWSPKIYTLRQAPRR